MKSTKKIYPIFYNFIAILFGVMMAGILFINLFVANRREFPWKFHSALHPGPNTEWGPY